MLYGRVLRSPYAHANIKRIDTSRALALPGVKAVITAADFPSPAEALRDIGRGRGPVPASCSDNFLASDKALYRGHAVAAVCAIDAHIAEDALELIEVEYEVLQPVAGRARGDAGGAPVLHDNLRTEDNAAVREAPGPQTNIAAAPPVQDGRPREGLRRGRRHSRARVHTKMYHQGYIEPHSGTRVLEPRRHI